MRIQIKNKCFVIAIFIGTLIPAHAFRVDFSIEDDFSEKSVQLGIKATKEQCGAIPEKAIWSVADASTAECIKFWSSGLNPNTGKAIVFFHGDKLAGDKVLGGYKNLTSTQLSEDAIKWSKRLNAPLIYIGRPGTHGSSGDHRRRRLLEEGQLISSTLDGLSKKYGITEFVIAGQSGGGHLTSSLITLRSDIVCAVPTSGANSPRIRFQSMGRARDTTNFDSYEPTENFNNPIHKDLRVVILGDPKDSNSVWNSQIIWIDQLTKRKVPHLVLEGAGSGSRRHGLQNSSREIAGMCFHGNTFDEMKDIQSKLKG
jgi:hypothetical protein